VTWIHGRSHLNDVSLGGQLNRLIFFVPTDWSSAPIRIVVAVTWITVDFFDVVGGTINLTG
jgi:hypothetical protein